MTIYKKQELLLEAKDLALSYGNKCILHDINFTIHDIIRPGMQQGQVVSLIGRSGIGKTQLFRILSGLQAPSSGQLRIRSGKDEDMRPVHTGDMGVIFQHYYQFEWRTVRQSLMLAAKQNTTLKGREAAAIGDYAEQFDLSDVLSYYPAQLSGGQRQRVSIIQQLLKGANFLLLDEPFSGLDVCVLDRVVDLLLQVSLSDERKTLIIVSHDISTAVAISDTVFILGKEPGKDGSTIIRSIDLIERDLAWKEHVQEEKAFAETIREIKAFL